METTKRKNNHGEGSISVRKDGIYQASIMCEGIRKYFYGTTEKEVRKSMLEYQAKLLMGVKESTVSFSNYFEYWLINIKKDKIKPASYDRLERTYRTHICSEIGKIAIGKLTSRKCQMLINKKAETLSYSTVKKILEAIRACLDYAVKVGDLERNPMAVVELPRENTFVKQTKTIEIPSEDDFEKIKAVAFAKYKNGKPIFSQLYVNAILLIAYTGLRAGEALALRWDKIDSNKSYMQIDSSISEIIERNGKSRKIAHVVTDTKTKSGNRTVYLNSRAKEALERIRQYQKENGISSDYVLSARDNKPASYHDLQRTLARILNRAEIPQFGLHTLRHYFASVCIAKGVDMIALSKMLGHSKTTVTLNVYAHILPKQNEALQQLLEAI